MKTVGNLLWFLLAGLWTSIAYVLAGALCIIFIVTIPLAIPSFRMASYVIWPFGRTVVKNPERGKALAVAANIVWVILFGWWLALIHLFTGAILCVTVIGIPLGLAQMKMAPLAFAPYGKLIVTKQQAHEMRLAVLGAVG
jgi:uncharacterized membrane protein YccF (DUF307 family)